MDGTVRDLAALRGTYRLIDKTDKAIILDICTSWINLNAKLVEEINKDYPYVDFMNFVI